MHFIGIDVAASRPCDIIVLDEHLGFVEHLVSTGLDGVRAAAEDLHQRYADAVVAIDAPRSPNTGLMTDARARSRLSPPPAPGKHQDCRVADYELSRRNVSVYFTPSRDPDGWMQVGFEWFERLIEGGFSDYTRTGDALPGSVIEYYPYASFVSLLGCTPAGKSSSSGRSARVNVLRDAGVDCDFALFTVDMLDAAVGALTARLLVGGSARDYGDLTEGVLTVAAKLPDGVRPCSTQDIR